MLGHNTNLGKTLVAIILTDNTIGMHGGGGGGGGGIGVGIPPLVKIIMPFRQTRHMKHAV